MNDTAASMASENIWDSRAMQRGLERPAVVSVPALAQILPAPMIRALGIAAVPRNLVVFTLVCVAFAWIVPTEIAIQTELFVSRTVLGIPVHYIPTAFVLALAIVFDSRTFVRLLSRPSVAFALLCFGFVLAVGIAKQGMGNYMVRSDVYILRWFVIGVILMRLAIASGMLGPFLVFACMTLALTAASIDASNTGWGELDTAAQRSGSTPLWAAVNCGTIFCSLLLATLWPKSTLYQVLGLVCFAANFFFGAVRTSTRSEFIVQALAFFLVLVALSRDPRMRGRGRSLARVARVAVASAFVYLIVQITRGKLLTSYSQLGDRFRENSGVGLWEYGTGLARVVEAREMLQGMEIDELLLGRGLGGGFMSILGAWYSCPHIGVFGWLLKGGFVIFGIALLTVYILPATGFVRQLLGGSRGRATPAPILLVGAGLLSWCALTLMSGGFDNGSMLGLGALAGLWMQLTDDERVLHASRRPAVGSRMPRCQELPVFGAAVAS
jgi:hypothetical protein